jgi:hypothetical protein
VSMQYGALGSNILVELDDGPIMRPMRARVESIGEEVRMPLYVDDYVYVDASHPVWVDANRHIMAVTEHDLYCQEVDAGVIRDEDLVEDDPSLLDIDATPVRRNIFEEIERERQYQDEVHGGPDNDDSQTEANWVKFVMDNATGTGFAACPGKPDKRPFRERMLKVAALAVAAIESHDRMNEKAWQSED